MYKRQTKVVSGMYDLSYEERLSRLELLSLENKRKRGDLIQLYKSTHNLDKIKWTKPINKVHSLSSEGPASAIRGHNLRIAKERTSFKPKEHFLLNRTANAWNNLPENIVSAGNIHIVKNLLDKYLLESN